MSVATTTPKKARRGFCGNVVQANAGKTGLVQRPEYWYECDRSGERNAPGYSTTPGQMTLCGYWKDLKGFHPGLVIHRRANRLNKR